MWNIVCSHRLTGVPGSAVRVYILLNVKQCKVHFFYVKLIRNSITIKGTLYDCQAWCSMTIT